MAKGDSGQDKDWWDKIEILGTVVTPLVIGVIGWLVTSAISERQIRSNSDIEARKQLLRKFGYKL